MAIDAEIGFTSDVIRDPSRFVGRTDLIRDCVKALNTSYNLISVYGKRGVGKSSLVRQIQQMALGDYTLAKQAGGGDLVPKRPRTYLTAYYCCDSMIKDGESLLHRLCNDQDDEDGLLRLVPDDGKELIEFERSREVETGADLKVIKWGAKGIESSKYARVIEGDVVQTFRNYLSSIVTHQVKKRMKRDSLLILLDEFDIIRDKTGLGSLIKSLSSPDVKFAICGIGRDLTDLVQDHASVERLLEEGSIHVQPMPHEESEEIVHTAERRFEGAIHFDKDVIYRIAEVSDGYPYFTQLIGKECVSQANIMATNYVSDTVFERVLDDIKSGRAFPTLESSYQRAIGNSTDRQLLLHLLAEQKEEGVLFNQEVGRIVLKKTRKEAEGFDIQYIDQLIPRLVDPKYGPVLERMVENQGIYEFVNPVFRLYAKMRYF